MKTDLQARSETPEQAFGRREWDAVFAALPSFTARARWVNPRPFDRTGCSKPAQLALARQLGFRVPRTRVTDEARSARALVSRTDVIYKA